MIKITNAKFYLEDLRTKFKKINIEEYYLSYSGGKDSHLLYWFIKEYAPEFNKIKVVGVNTYLEHEQIRKRIYDNCDVVLLPKMKPFEIKEKFGIPCFSKAQDLVIEYYQKGSRAEWVLRNLHSKVLTKDGKLINNKYCLNKKAVELLTSGKLHKISKKCCDYLKKKPIHDFEKETNLKSILGVRGNESVLRKTNYKSCFTRDKKFTPLWDLTDNLEKEIYEEFKIEIPPIYEQVTRTGCFGCPYGSWKHDTEKELALLNESQRKFVYEYFKESYNVLGILKEGDENEEQKRT